VSFANDGPDSDEELSESGQAYEHVEVDPEEARQMEQFMAENPEKRRTLADIIMEKLNEKRTEIESQMSGINRYLSIHETKQSTYFSWRAREIIMLY